jgi:hypothetical protein
MAAALSLGIIGCSGPTEPPPPTYLATGRVVHKKGGQPVKSGLIEFFSTSDPTVRLRGIIQPDGTFALTTPHEGKQISGALEGEYRVKVSPSSDDPLFGVSIPLPRPLKIAPKENNFTIEIDRPRGEP